MAGTLVPDLIGIPKAFYFQSADPAIANPTHLRTGIQWIDTTSSPYVWKRRNAANDGWDTLGKIRTDAQFNTDVDGRITAANLATKNAEINAQTGTTYTLVAADNGKVVTCSNAGGITVTVPSGLGAGFNCLVVQLGAGQVTFSPSSTTVNNRQSHTKIAGQYGIATLVAYVANTFALGGDTAT